MIVNARTIALIKSFEGFRAKAYVDVAGVLTIGYGTTAAADVGITPKLGMTISEADATLYLRRAVDKFAKTIASQIRQPINENEFGAFVSLAYNIGPGAFLSSSALRYFNAGQKRDAGLAILSWNKATVRGKKVTLAGLVRRREAELALFNAPVNQSVPPVSPDALPTAKTSLWALILQFISALFRGKK